MTQGDNPVQNAVFRAVSVPLSHPGLEGRNLDAGAPLELNPLPLDCTVDVGEMPIDQAIRAWPNPASTSLTIGQFKPDQPTQIVIFDATGNLHWNGIATHESNHRH